MQTDVISLRISGRQCCHITAEQVALYPSSRSEVADHLTLAAAPITIMLTNIEANDGTHA